MTIMISSLKILCHNKLSKLNEIHFFIWSNECILVTKVSRAKQKLSSKIQTFYIQCHVTIKLTNISEIKLIPYHNSYLYFCFYILIQLAICKLKICDAFGKQFTTYVNLIFMLFCVYYIYVYCLYHMPFLCFLNEYSFNNIYLLLIQVEIGRIVDVKYFVSLCDYLILYKLNTLASKNSLYYRPSLYFVQVYPINNIYLLLIQIETVRLVVISCFLCFCDYLVLSLQHDSHIHYDLQNNLASKKLMCVVFLYIFSIINIQNVG